MFKHLRYAKAITTQRRSMKLKMIAALCASLAFSACSHLPTQASVTTTSSSVGAWQHVKEFQNIAKQHNNQRSVGSQGGQASAEYILKVAKTTPYTVQMLPFENREKTVGQNIIVEIKGQNPNQAIIVGAHYDSVKAGPGINDNASGVAVLLSLLEAYAKNNQQPRYTLYLAFWDSEEVGIAGSQHFAKQLSKQQLQGIQAYINVDMVGTKNPTALVLDADKSSVDDLEQQLKANGMPANEYAELLKGLRSIPSHPNDAYLQQVLSDFLKQKNIPIREDLSTLVASDTAGFLGKVPVASIILFNEQMKGDILEFAPCYHQACDDLSHIDANSLGLAQDALVQLIQAIEQKP